jgi:hypothetical protein
LLIVMTSPDALLKQGTPDPAIAQVLIKAKQAKNPVGVISNRGEPAWFGALFAGTGVQFLQAPGRQSGEIVSRNAMKFSLNPFDVLVLAAKDEDVQMGKNGGAVLVAAGWATSKQVGSLGIRVDDAKQLQEVIDLTAAWAGQWWYSGASTRYQVRALADLSGYGKSITQQEFGQKVTATVKTGGSRLNALLAVTARSILMEGSSSADNLLWGVYPSSASKNDDTEVLSDFTHRLRTTVSRVRHCRRGEPLFIRHKVSQKRSAGGVGDRTDPTEQILTIHLNPFYEQHNRLVGRHVIVVDDCATYGVSFGVAAAFLRKAGAAAVTGVALGKFGNQLRWHSIDIKASPFKPVSAGQFAFTPAPLLAGTTNAMTQQALLSIIR